MTGPRLPQALRELRDDLAEASPATLGEARQMLDSILNLRQLPGRDATESEMLNLLLRMLLGVELADRDRAFEGIVAGLEKEKP